jgi:MYXO-CTERM domain-containing protein
MNFRLRSFLCVVLFTAAALVPAVASANGRFPSANQIAFNPKDPQSMILRTTFGLLRSHNRGKNVNLICDSIIGAASVVDPGVAITSDGSYIVAAPDGLAVSHDDGCGFPFMGGALAKERFIDAAVDHQNPARAVALTATTDPASPGTEHVQVFETQDNGVTWAAVGVALDPNQIVTTIDVAPSNPLRLYMSGNTIQGSKLQGFIATSVDAGKTWQRYAWDFPRAAQLYIAGVDPVDEQLLYVRTYFSDNGPSSLLVSHDGGKTFGVAVTVDALLTGFALSPDGSRVAIGSPKHGVMVANRVVASGAADGGPSMTFEQHASDAIFCLGWEGDTLFGCGFGVEKGCGTGTGEFMLASSADEGKTWSTLVPSLGAIEPPAATCAADSPSTKVCGPDWPRMHAILECGFRLDAGADAADSGDAGTPRSPARPDECSCRMVGDPAVRSHGGGVAVVVGVLALLRRRRRSDSPTRARRRAFEART